MKDKAELSERLAYFQSLEGGNIRFDEAAIAAAYQGNTENQSLSIKIVTMLGGLLASLAFIAFLFLTGIYDSGAGLLGMGIGCLAGAIWLSRVHSRLIYDTLAVSAFILGFVLVGMGLSRFELDENMISLALIPPALLAIRIAQNYILSFIAILIINGCVLSLILSNDGYNLVQGYVAFLAIATTYLFLKEAQIIAGNSRFNILYNPARTGLIFSFLSGLILLGKKGLVPVSPDYLWLTSIVILAAISYTISLLFDLLSITLRRQKAGVYLVCLCLLMPSILSPAISGAVLILLLSFLVNYKTGLVIGVVSLIYFISRYYYDLTFTLLTKSILLFSSGILFLGLYVITNKTLGANEKV